MTLQVLVFLAALARNHGLHVPLAASPRHRNTHCAPDVCHRAERTADITGSCEKGGVHVFDNGVKVCEDTIIELQRDRYKTENLHEPVESKIFYSLISRANSNDTFVDVGGAVGFYALWALKVVPALQVWAFNPSPYFRQHFANHAILNFPGEAGELGRLCQDFRAMTIVDDDHMAIGAEYGSAVNNGGTNARQAACTTVTYATWAGEKHVQSPFLVMTDIQGAEATVVPSMLAGGAAPSLLMVGTHRDDIHTTVLGALRGHGYSVLYEERTPKDQPDGILVAVRDQWQRAHEFKGLVPHFANATALGMPFKQYADVQKQW